MTIDALPSKYGLPSQEPRKTPTAAATRPSSAAESSNRMATRLGSLERRIAGQIPCPSSLWANWRAATIHEAPSMRAAAPRTT